MEIKVGQKWKRHTPPNWITKITNTIDFDGRIYYECLSLNVNVYWTASKDELIDILENSYSLIPPFRPHWLLDNGTKIYADETYCFGNDDQYSLLVPLNGHLYDLDKYCPSQCKNKECDFGILFKDGGHMWAKWIGEEND